MKKILVLHDESQKDQLLVALLMLLFPRCEIHVLHESIESFGNGAERSIYVDCQEAGGKD